MKKIMVVILVLGIFFSYSYAEETMKSDDKSRLENAKQQTNVVIIGFPKGQAAGLQKEIEYVATERSYVNKGYEYLENEQFDKAIEQFEIVLKRNRPTGALAEARQGLVDTYEKKHDYQTAAKLFEGIIATFKIPKGNMWRLPDDERLAYLLYASNGDYDLAVEHAQKSIEADAKLPNRPKNGSPEYYKRLNDLKAAKDYILSLKKK